MGSAVSLKTNDSREPARALPSTRGSDYISIPDASPARARISPHERAVARPANQDGSPQMVPLTRRTSSSVSVVPSSISSLEHASPVVTPSLGVSTPSNAAIQRVRGSSGISPQKTGAKDTTALSVGNTTHINLQSEGVPPGLSFDNVVDDVPPLEAVAVMTAALMKPYPLLCRRLGSNKTCTSSLASRVVNRLARSDESDASDRASTTMDPATVRPNIECLAFDEPPLGVSDVVASSYPARWVPTITRCFDDGLLYRIEWRRRGTCKLPGDTGDCAYVVWCFYNSTPCYQMEIDVCFEMPAKCTTTRLQGWGETKLSWTEEPASGKPSASCHSEVTARAVCPPLSTVGFVMGRAGAFRTAIRGVPLPPAIPSGLPRPASETTLSDAQRCLSSEEGLRLALRERRRFVDPEFPPSNASLLGSAPGASLLSMPAATPQGAANWLRTSDIVARLVGASCVPLTRLHQPLVPIIDPLFIEPGELGDSWLVGAMAAAAEHPVILLRMFRHPKSSEHAKMERAIGAFRMTLNVEGWWRSVVVDDYLPVTAGNYPKYAHSRRDIRELWMELLEKAFAKLHGGYANIVAGDPLDALRVLTGWPCARYDIANFKDIAVASSAFASRLQRYDQHGLQIIFHTAPQLSSPTRHRGDELRSSAAGASVADASLAVEDDGAGGGNGLVPGMVYAVLQILQFSTNTFRPELTLVQVRNVWGDVAAWRGRWQCGSPRWARWPKVAEACHMPLQPTHQSLTDTPAPVEDEVAHRPSPSDCACRREQYIWLEWSEVYRYFSGCGVMFRLALHHDYRVQGVFDGVRPSVCLRVTVTSRSFIGLTLSLQGTEEEAPQLGDGGAASARPPIMISLAREQANVLHVIRNSQLDPDNPTALFTFMQVGDVSLLSSLTPEDSPYWVIPRLLPTAASASSGGAGARAVQHPYVIGYFQKDAAGVKDGPRVEFVQLSETSPAFQNCTCFSLGDDVTPVRAKFQAKSPQAGFPSTFIHTEVSEEGGTRADDDFDTAATACM